MNTHTLRLPSLIALIFSVLVPSAPAHAATFTVTNLNDSDAGSLRQAITDANAAAGADTITFSLNGDILLGSTLPNITAAGGALTINGTGRTNVSGFGAVRVLFVDAGASLTLNSLGIVLGAASSGNHGGGIFNLGTLTITSGFISGNSTSLGGGGAIMNSGGTLTVSYSTFSGNNATGGFGGSIYNNVGTTTITDSTFSGNSATYGGAIYNNSGTTTITSSTFSSNSAADIGYGSWGGGVFVGAGSTVTLTNSTFSGNSATTGGGIFNQGTLTMTNSTLSGNSATTGGGIDNGAGTVTLRNTIVANSTSGGNCAGTITNGGNNIDDGMTCGWTSTNDSRSGTNPNLGALADNGGPTQTFALLTGSPAIDAVTFNAPNSAPSTDQRGVTRPQGVRYDIGAYETTVQPGPTFVVNTTADIDGATCEYAPEGSYCSLREAINAANAHAGADTITFSLSGTITLGSQLPNITAAGGALTIDGTGKMVTISGNYAVLVAAVYGGASLTLNSVTITNGKFGANGGGVWNAGTLTITNSTFSGNSANWGGGIYNASTGTLTVTNSTFSGNSAIWGGGGGIYNYGTSTITNSAFSGNSANWGSGIYSGAGTLTVTASTFSGNTGVFGVGGIEAVGTAILRNTIVANNTGGNCGSAIANGGNNIDDGSTCGWGSTNGSMTGTNPLLGALASNGGPTQTFALLKGSPAIDGVTFNAPNGSFSTDQRGIARPLGVRYDIGSYEFNPPNDFTDDPLTAGMTTVKAVHITELRTRIDAIRIAKGLLAYPWADSSLGAAWLIRAQHIVDLRTALAEAYTAAGRTPPTYTTDPPPSLVPGVTVKAAHITEIRTAVVAIE